MADAQLTIGANADAATRAAALVKQTWTDAGKAITSSIGSAAQQVIGDLASVATAQGKINFSAQHQQVRDFEQSTARLAVSMGRDLESVRGSIVGVGTAINKRPQEVAQWAAEVGKLTYNFAGAVDAQKGLAGLAAETGRQVGDYKGLAVELANVGKVGGDTTDVISALTAQSEKLGNAGGVAAFTDQIEGLSDVIGRMGDRSTASLLRVTALAGALGKELDPQAAARAQQGVLGTIQNDPMRWERFLGRKLLNEHGQISEGDMPKITRDITAKTIKRFGNRAERVLEMNFGNEQGAAMFNAYKRGDLDESSIKAATLGRSSKAIDALKAYQRTDAGKREGAETELAKSAIALMGSSTLLGQAADKLQQFAAHNPVTSTFASTAAGGILGGLTSAAGALLKGGGGIALKAAGVAAGTVAAVGASAIAGGVAGGYLGNYLSNKYDEHQKPQEKYDLAVMDSKTAEMKQKRDAVRAARAVAGRTAELEKGGVAHAFALRAAGLEVDAATHNGKSNGLEGPALQAAIADAIKKGIAAAKFNVTTRQDTPVEIAAGGTNHPSAGNQGN